MTRTLILATTNPGKARELAHALQGLRIRVLTLGQSGFRGKIRENGKTLEENAVKKAEAVSRATGLAALADDTGLFVRALPEKLGVRTARFAKTGAEKRRKLLRLLRGKTGTGRRAEFRCVVAVAVPGRKTRVFRGALTGRISEQESAVKEPGLYYSPIFYVPRVGKMLSETREAAATHRARAVAKARAYLARVLR